MSKIWGIFYEGKQMGPNMPESIAKAKYKRLSESLLNLDLRMIQRPGGEFSAWEIKRKYFQVVGD